MESKYVLIGYSNKTLYYAAVYFNQLKSNVKLRGQSREFSQNDICVELLVNVEMWKKDLELNI